MTTQDKIQGVTSCTAELINGAGGACTEDVVKSQKWTWAVPLEIVYMTPLASWNPWDLDVCLGSSDSKDCRHTLEGPAGDRTGGLTEDTAYKGTARDTWYVTPEEFYSGEYEEVDPADTSGGVVGVLDKNGVVRRTRAAGHWVHWPRIKGFKTNLRQRYPVMPIHEHGTTSWKEVKALQDIMIDAGGSSALRASLDRIREERIGVSLKLMYTTGGASNVGPHEHAMHVTGEQVKQMDEDGFLELTTSMDNGHTHSVKLARETIEMTTGVLTHRYQLLKCDQGQLCGDEGGYRQHYDAMHAAVMSEGPWAYYTDVETQYEVDVDGKAAVWQDMSGNDRNSVRITLNGNTPKDKPFEPRPFKQHPAPYKQDTAPETASVVCNDEQGLLFPNGSIPSGKFTIIARAKYIKAEGMRQGRILRGSKSTKKTPEWYLGWAGYLGVGSYHGTQIHNNGQRIHDDTRYNFHTVAGRSTTVSPLFIDGVARQQTPIDRFAVVDDPNVALVIGALDDCERKCTPVHLPLNMYAT